MAGHMGSSRVTTQNLKIVRTDSDRGILMVKGSVPGSKGAWVAIRDAVKDPISDKIDAKTVTDEKSESVNEKDTLGGAE